MNRLLSSKLSHQILFNSTRSRTKNATNLSKLRTKKQSVDLALNHYDTFYSKIYQRSWQSIRLALLSPNKYGAIVNNFADSADIEIKLRVDGAYNLRYIYEKNQRRIAREIARKKFLKEKAAKTNATNGQAVVDNDENGNNSIISTTSDDEGKNLPISSDSEFEEIGAFFTDSDGDDTFINAAQMELNFDDYVPVSELKYKEVELPFQEELEYSKFVNIDEELSIETQTQEQLTVPASLNIYTYPRNDFRSFQSPTFDRLNIFNYYLFDCASALPVLALDVKDGEHIADLCAAPGGKSLMMFLAGQEGCRFFLNEISSSRFVRLKDVFVSFIPRSKQSNITFNNQDACRLRIPNTFDKILVDVPCTNDRHSLFVNDNNIFSSKRNGERLTMPSKQMSILTNALSMVKPGGTVVYSTCSLSPIQNDSVVHMSLKKMMDFQNATYAVVNLKEAFRPFRGIFCFDHRFRYGTQVIPNLCSNFGPMYISKIIRID